MPSSSAKNNSIFTSSASVDLLLFPFEACAWPSRGLQTTKSQYLDSKIDKVVVGIV